MKLTKRQRSGYAALDDEKQPSGIGTMKAMLQQEGWSPLGGHKKKDSALDDEKHSSRMKAMKGMLEQEGWSSLRGFKKRYSALDDEQQPSRLEIKKHMVEQEGWCPLGGYNKKSSTLFNEKADASQYAVLKDLIQKAGWAPSGGYNKKSFTLYTEKADVSQYSASKTIIEKAGWSPLGGYGSKLLDQYKWSECPEEEARDLKAIFDSAPPNLNILIESYPDGLIALDSRHLMPWLTGATSSTAAASCNAFTDEDREDLKLWFQAVAQHHRIHRMKVEMEEEKKGVGWGTWTFWCWMDTVRGTRRAWEKLGERCEARRAAEAGEKGDGEEVPLLWK